jgi:hypothetical protein
MVFQAFFAECSTALLTPPRTAHPFPVKRDDVTFPDIVLLGSASPWTPVSASPADPSPATASPAAPADPLSVWIGPAEVVELTDG